MSHRQSPIRRPLQAASSASPERQQARVDEFFDAESHAWQTIYEERTVFARIHQDRQERVLHSIDALALAHGTPVLEVGCGAGLTALALADRGLDVTATDHAAAMVELTDRAAHERGLADLIHPSVADAHHLPFPDGSFSLVVALGVLPWLHTPDRAIDEMARVVRPGGYVIANVDNLLRLHYLLDPRLNPAFAALRRRVGRVLRRLGVMDSRAPIRVHLTFPRSFDASLARAGLIRGESLTHGFGPFTYWGRPVFSEGDGLRLHQALQSASDRGTPVLRSMGAQYRVTARKSNGARLGSRQGDASR